MNNTEYRRQLLQIAVPVALQALLASSFSIVDQIMIGQMGSASIAGVGIGSIFSSMFWFTVGAIINCAGILIAQYIGQKNDLGLRRSFWLSLSLTGVLSLLFMGVTLAFAPFIASLYTSDPEVIAIASDYLRIFAWAFLPQALTNLMSVILRCINKAAYPTLVSLVGVFLNTFLNFGFIFGNMGFPAMGAVGAALASLISMSISCLLSALLFYHFTRKEHIGLRFCFSWSREELLHYFRMLAPMLATEFLWVLGNNIYSSCYGHIGTLALAGMNISNTIISLIMGALSGLGQAASIMTGKALGKGDFHEAYTIASRLIKTSFAWSVGLALLTALLAPLYTAIYQVESTVKLSAIGLLWIFAFYAPIKTENMVIGAGILQSGGKTQYNMLINILGTWGVGIPLGLLCTYVWHLPLLAVYAILSVEELVRMILCLIVFKKKLWVSQLSANL